ncbi:homeobox-leucine zipper protein ATHB-40-like [Bidens hawaiensis]|uniref:homeobox-leucine zipper protein ATHB-40-like n=1 Tax=Bidens hawaiensis TaxID=980011 RepID=UPI00404B8E52
MNTARSARNNKASSSGLKNRKLTDEKLNVLEYLFEDNKKLELNRKNDIAAQLNLDPQQVAVWFQNKRARCKSKSEEAENLQLKEANCCLEKELQLSEVKDQRDRFSNELSEVKEKLASVSNERDELIREKLEGLR